jgi:hypothetical protein
VKSTFIHNFLEINREIQDLETKFNQYEAAADEDSDRELRFARREVGIAILDRIASLQDVHKNGMSIHKNRIV